MPSPTQEDIDRLRERPEKAGQFEKYFGVPAQQFLNGDKPRPTEQDILRLKKVPEKRDKFDAHFGTGSADRYLAEPDHDEVSTLGEVGRKGSVLERMNPTFIQNRIGTAVSDVLGDMFNPINVANSVSAVGDVVSRVPKIVSTPEGRGEMIRGAYQGALTTPGAISDLALAGMDIGGQLLAGNEPLTDYNPAAYEENPLGAAHTAVMLEDWGNKATDALGLGDKVFDFNDPGTEEARTARQLGAFIGTGGLAGGRRALIPSTTGAIGAEAAREVAPDDPNWQLFGGAAGAGAPLATRAGARGVRSAVGAVTPSGRQFTSGGRGVVAGNALQEAAGPGFDPAAALPDNPLAAANAEIMAAAAPDQPIPDTFQPTMGQLSGNRGILALEKSQAMSAPDIARQFADRQATNQAVTRKVIAGLRGTGSPEDLRAVSERAMEIADLDTRAAEGQATTGLSQSQAGMAARKQIETQRQKVRETRQELWNDPSIKDVPIAVDPLRMQLAQYFQDQGPAYDGIMPADVQATLRRLGETSTLIDLQNVRAELGNYARDAAGKNDSNMARVYGDLRDITGDFIDNQDFPGNPDALAAYKKARAYSFFENKVYKQPDEMRAVLGKNRFGGQTVAPAETLQQFIKPGAAGLDTVDQLLASNNTKEMHNVIGDHLYDLMMSKGAKAKDGGTFLRQYADTLNKLPIVKGKLQQIVAKRAAAEALAKSPMNLFVGKEPDVAIDKLFAHQDRIRATRQLKAQLLRADPSGRAWEGLKASTADKILRTVDSAIERDAMGNPTIKPGVMNSFYRQNADIIQEILGTQSVDTIRNVADAVEMMTRTARSGKEMGSPTAPALAGDRFLDHMLEKYISSPAGPIGSGATLATAGTAVAGPIGGLAGFGVGVAGHLAFSSAKSEVSNLLARALLNPEEGKAMMMPPTPASVRALPYAVRPYLRNYIPRAAAGAAAAPQAGKEPTKKTLKPGQTVSGVMDGQPVTWTYKGGDPKEQASWARAPQ